MGEIMGIRLVSPVVWFTVVSVGLFASGAMASTYSYVGDRVWEDLNGNGIQDAGEPGIQGALIYLTKANNASPRTFGPYTTDANGYYLVGPMSGGNTQVQFIVQLPGGYVFTLQDQGTDDAVDSDANPADGKTAWFFLPAGTTDLTWDAGVYRPAQLGDYVWDDLDRDGVQDSNEVGIAGVTVRLLDASGAAVDTTATDSNGYYLFSGLRPGTYSVEFVPPSGYVFSARDQDGDDALDSDADPSNGRTAPVALISGQSNLTLDAGLYQQRASIGDFVWADNNMNGIQDEGEPGVDGVTVKLLDAQGRTIDFRITSGGGYYLFTDLLPGTYSLVFLPPVGYRLTPQNQGGDSTKDSDADSTTGVTTPTVLSPGQTDLTWDAGLYALAEIGDRVWLDANANGIQDSGEVGVDGIGVKLLNANGAVIAIQVTSGGGLYKFTDLVPGTYSLQFEAPGYNFSPQDQGSDDAADSDANPADGKTVATVLSSGESDMTWDAGLYQLASIGDRVWNDTNSNGIQDSGEPGIDGVTVNLLDSAGAVIGTQVTSGGGLYLFSGLMPGTYSLQFIAPSGMTPSPWDQGADDSKDSDANPSDGNTVQTVLESGEVDLTWDAGFYTPQQSRITIVKSAAKVTGNCKTVGFWKNNIRKHLDGKRGWQVPKADLLAWLRAVQAFYRPDPFQLGTTDTQILQRAYDILDYSGSDMAKKTRKQLLACELNYVSVVYSMSDRAYHEQFIKSVEDALNTPGANLGPLHDMCDWINNLGEGSSSSCICVGDMITFSITVSAESLPAPRQIEVRDYLDSGLEFISATNGGVYVSRRHYVKWTVDLPAGSSSTVLQVVVRVDEMPYGDSGRMPSGDWTVSNWVELDIYSSCPSGSCAAPSSASSGSGNVGAACPPPPPPTPSKEVLKNRAMFGTPCTRSNASVGSIGSLVWDDRDRDKRKDRDEEGIAGVVLQLVNSYGDVVETSTDAEGKYKFGGLAAGTYTVIVDVTTLPAGAVQTYDLDGQLDHQATVSLAAGQTRTDVDFGYGRPRNPSRE